MLHFTLRIRKGGWSASPVFALIARWILFSDDASANYEQGPAGQLSFCCFSTPLFMLSGNHCSVVFLVTSRLVNETSLSANQTKFRAVLIVIMSAISSSWLVYLVTVFVLPYCSHRLSKEENDMSRHPAHRLPVQNKPESKIGYGSIHVPAASLHLGLCRDRWPPLWPPGSPTSAWEPASKIFLPSGRSISISC